MPDELWEVFLSPHTDDETLAMAGAITRARIAGLNVCVVLVTDNQPSIKQVTPVRSRQYLHEVRRLEFVHALKQLDVTSVEMWEISEDAMITTPFIMQDQILSRLDDLCTRLHVVHVHTVCGLDDIHIHAGYGSVAHALCANAVTTFSRIHPFTSASLHGVYVYAKPVDERTICGSLHLRKDVLSRREWTRKVSALLCYRPGHVSIGYGYYSVPDLFDNAMMDPHEYTIAVNS